MSSPAEKLKHLESVSADEIISRVKFFYHSLVGEIRKSVVGQQDVIDLIIIGLIAKGNVLLEGVPGLGKTLLFKTLSRCLSLKFQHVQFTPDLMPSDIIGTEIIQNNPETHSRELKFMRGPVFCNFLLADEINRTSPKTQSALLQAMQDREVSVGNHTYLLDEPFFVVATQNPIDQEGVYPLPEAQLDRFMFNVFIDYPDHQEEVEIAKRYTSVQTPEISPVIDREDILTLQSIVRSMIIAESLIGYAVHIAAATRPNHPHALPFVKDAVEWGAGPRASLNLVLAAKARALLKGRLCVASEDIRAVAPSVLRHRIKLNFAAEAENIKTLDIIRKVIESVPEAGKR